MSTCFKLEISASNDLRAWPASPVPESALVLRQHLLVGGDGDNRLEGARLPHRQVGDDPVVEMHVRPVKQFKLTLSPSKIMTKTVGGISPTLCNNSSFCEIIYVLVHPALSPLLGCNAANFYQSISCD